LADDLGRNAGHALALLERPRLDRRAVLLEARRRALDEEVVGEPGVDYFARNRVRESDVGADIEPEPGVRPLRRAGAPRIDDVQPRAVVHGLEDVVEEDRMRLAGVRAPEDQQIRLLDLLIGRRATARTEYRRQTDDARSVSSAVARVDVVRPHHRADELLGQEVHLV